MVLANGLIKANDSLASSHDSLIQQLPQLADSTRNHARELVSPVGSTCKSLRQFSRTEREITISEPEAEVIRGGIEMEIDDMQQLRCKRIREVNVENGHCLLDVDGFDGLI